MTGSSAPTIVGADQVHLPEVAQGWTEIAGVERAGQRLYAMETGPGLVVEVAGDGDDAIDVIASGCQQQGDGGTPGVADQLQRLGVGLLLEGIARRRATGSMGVGSVEGWLAVTQAKPSPSR